MRNSAEKAEVLAGAWREALGGMHVDPEAAPGGEL